MVSCSPGRELKILMFELYKVRRGLLLFVHAASAPQTGRRHPNGLSPAGLWNLTWCIGAQGNSGGLKYRTDPMEYQEAGSNPVGQA
jgi:hypothetical protein